MGAATGVETEDAAAALWMLLRLLLLWCCGRAEARALRSCASPLSVSSCCASCCSCAVCADCISGARREASMAGRSTDRAALSAQRLDQQSCTGHTRVRQGGEGRGGEGGGRNEQSTDSSKRRSTALEKPEPRQALRSTRSAATLEQQSTAVQGAAGRGCALLTERGMAHCATQPQLTPRQPGVAVSAAAHEQPPLLHIRFSLRTAPHRSCCWLQMSRHCAGSVGAGLCPCTRTRQNFERLPKLLNNESNCTGCEHTFDAHYDENAGGPLLAAAAPSNVVIRIRRYRSRRSLWPTCWM